MKSPFPLSFIVGALAYLALGTTVQAESEPRTVLIENFNSGACTTCPLVATTVYGIIDRRPSVTLLEYHTQGGPFGSSPERISYYGVQTLPATFIDGDLVENPLFLPGYEPLVLERLSSPAPLRLELFTRYWLELGVRVIAHSPGTWHVWLATCHDSLAVQELPPSGQQVFRHVSPRLVGRVFDASCPCPTSMVLTMALDWLDLRDYVVAFAQNDATHEVVQAAASPIAALPAPVEASTWGGIKTLFR